MMNFTTTQYGSISHVSHYVAVMRTVLCGKRNTPCIFIMNRVDTRELLISCFSGHPCPEVCFLLLCYSFIQIISCVCWMMIGSSNPLATTEKCDHVLAATCNYYTGTSVWRYGGTGSSFPDTLLPRAGSLLWAAHERPTPWCHFTAL